MMITSAGANKLLRKLEDDKQFLLSQENAAATYIVSEGMEPIVPDYDYRQTAQTLLEIEAPPYWTGWGLPLIRHWCRWRS